MNATENLKASGSLRVVVTGADGKVKEEHQFKNLVVTVGKNFVASRMVGTASAVMSHMAVGSNNNAAAAGDTALGAELGRVALSTSVATTNVVTYTATFPAGTGTGAIVEAGIFNASSAGTMLCRTVFAVVNKGVDDALSITWTITIS
jgi:outer membrane protein assembly factor BamB